MSLSKSALKSSRPHSISKKIKKLGFDPVVRTLSGNIQTYKLYDIDRHHKINPRRKGFYRKEFQFEPRYSTDKLAYQPVNTEECWTTSEEFEKAVAEKREEEFNFGRKWNVDAVKGDKVSICDMITNLCTTMTKKVFSKLFWKKPVENTTVTVQRGGKRTQKKRKFNTRKRRPKV
jgi:hypothetical protein